MRCLISFFPSKSHCVTETRTIKRKSLCLGKHGFTGQSVAVQFKRQGDVEERLAQIVSAGNNSNAHLSEWSKQRLDRFDVRNELHQMIPSGIGLHLFVSGTN